MTIGVEGTVFMIQRAARGLINANDEISEGLVSHFIKWLIGILCAKFLI